MLEHIVEFTAWPILTGILIGYVANRIMSGEGKGCCMNLIIGIIGSYVGTGKVISPTLYSASLVPFHSCGFGRNCLIDDDEHRYHQHVLASSDEAI